MLKRLSRAIALPDRQDADEFNERCMIDAKKDRHEILTKILSAYNVAKIKNCLDAEVLSKILSAARGIFRAREDLITANKVPDGSRLSYTRRSFLVEELDVEMRAALLPEIILRGARDFLGKEPIQAVSSVRAIVPGPSDQRLPFHPDQAILQTPLLNIWIPLTPCGVTAPSLEVAVTNRRKLLEVIGSKDDEIPVERVRIDEQLVAATFGTNALWHPVMTPGEVLVFTGTTAHRTFVTPRMNDSRISMELRLV